MGVEYSAKLIVGLPCDEFGDFFSDDIVGDCEEKGLEYASPYYDAPPRHWVIGVRVAKSGDYDWNYVDVKKHKDAHDQFTKVTGLVGKLILSTHGY